jgi:hypothetical protein
MERWEVEMREIKFRAWVKDEQMVYGVSPKADDNSVCYFGKGNIVGCVPMQYTGLKDDSGKEIYEGDIVSPIAGYGSCGEIRYCEEACAFMCIPMYGGKSEDYLSAAVIDGAKVIGNIHESFEDYCDEHDINDFMNLLGQ